LNRYEERGLFQGGYVAQWISFLYPLFFCGGSLSLHRAFLEKVAKAKIKIFEEGLH